MGEVMVGDTAAIVPGLMYEGGRRSQKAFTALPTPLPVRFAVQAVSVRVTISADKRTA